MADNEVIVVDTDNKYAAVRKRPVIKETRSLAEKWLKVQILERQASVTSWKAQMINYEGKIETVEAELRDLQDRLANL